jgi:ABC-type nitrate/sulfonate/bicarbonate transport system ATPase subunit
MDTESDDEQEEGHSKTSTLTSITIPQDFAIGVILGPSASGKSTLLRKVRAAGLTGLSEWRNDATEHTDICIRRDLAVVSSFKELGFSEKEAIDRLASVGLNKIPSWLRPFGQLSNGERSRASLAMSLRSDMSLDDFCQLVDSITATSMAYALARAVRVQGLRRILVTTTKPEIVRFLQPDFCILTATGELLENCNRVANPAFVGKIEVEIEAPGMKKLQNFLVQERGWEGELDAPKGSLQTMAVGKHLIGHSFQSKTVFPKHARQLVSHVVCDSYTKEASEAFELNFTGRTEQVIALPSINDVMYGKVYRTFHIGLFVGASGTGEWIPSAASVLDVTAFYL